MKPAFHRRLYLTQYGIGLKIRPEPESSGKSVMPRNALKKEIKENCTERNRTGQAVSVWLRRKWRQLLQRGHDRSQRRRRSARRRRSNKARDSRCTISNTFKISSSRSARRIIISTALKPSGMILILEVATSYPLCVCFITAIRLAVRNCWEKGGLTSKVLCVAYFLKLLFERKMLRGRTHVHGVFLVA